ncbi:MAG: spore coat protein [Spirochaetaceae bacterium]|nr:MAG: spore coat protein [Spirochaetaceae bacterium]
MNPVQIGSHVKVGKGERCFIIAEAGTAHGGDLDAGRRLIDAAASSGADCVKFQAVFADEIVHPTAGSIQLPGGKTDIYARFKEVERDGEFYAALKEYAESKRLMFLCSAFGLGSARILQETGVSVMKIASPELNHFPLLDEVSSWGLPVFLSTGISQLADIEAALEHCACPAMLLHCVTSYPAPEEEYNCRIIPLLSGIFDIPVGISDHSLDPLLVPGTAVMEGAAAVEKHLTLSRTGGGLDDPIALDEKAFSKMVSGIRNMEKMSRDEAAAWLGGIYGQERVQRVLGTGRKHLSSSERDNYFSTRRSLLAWKDIKRGEKFSEKNTVLLRSEKNTPPGLSPEFLPIILGKKSCRDIPAGAGISWTDVIPD